MILLPIALSPFLTKFAEASYVLVSSGLIVYRKRIVGLHYYIDFSEDGGSSWELGIVDLVYDESSIIISIDGNPSGYRQAVRGRNYYIDQELTPTGFAGTENVDWETIYYITK